MGLADVPDDGLNPRLVGRAVELELIAALGAGSTSALFVHGEPGVGKTTLLRAGLAEVAHVTGGALATLDWMAFLPLRRAFSTLPEETWSGDSAHVASEVELALAGRVLCVEDLHWADDDTLATVEDLIGRVPLVATVRRGESHSGEVVAALEKAGATRMDLEPLAPQHARALASRLRPELTDADLARVLAHSGGNPLLIEELVAAGKNDQSLRLALLARCRRLGDQAMEELALLALAGHALPADHLAAVDELVESGIARVRPDGEAEIRHALIGETVAAELSQERRLRCHTRLAAVVDHPGEVARHRLAAGDRTGARAAAQEAVDQARSPGEKWRHLATLAEATDGDAAPLARAKAATAATAAGEPEVAGRLLADLPVAGPHAVDIALARATWAFQSGRWDAYVDEVVAARELVVPGSAAEARLLQREATVARIIRNDSRRGLEVGLQALDAAIRTGERVSGARGSVAGAMAELGMPGWQDAYEEALAAAAVEGDHYPELAIRHNFIISLTAAGELARAREVATAQESWCRELRLLKKARSAEVARLVIDAYTGAQATVLRRCDELLAEGLARVDELDVHILRGTVLAYQGSLEDALAALTPLRGVASVEGDVHSISVTAYAVASSPEEAWAAWELLGETDGVEDVAAAEAVRWACWAAWETGRTDLPPQADVVPGLAAGMSVECEGVAALVAGDFAAAATAFARAADAHGPRAWDAAWCRWALGEALRLARDPRAVEVLAAAEEEAGAAGYEPILNRCRRSLRAVGVRPAPRPGSGPDVLTPSERAVVDLLVEGLTDREIAVRLGVTHRTVQTQVASARSKLGVHTRTQLAALAAGP